MCIPTSPNACSDEQQGITAKLKGKTWNDYVLPKGTWGFLNVPWCFLLAGADGCVLYLSLDPEEYDVIIYKNIHSTCVRFLYFAYQTIYQNTSRQRVPLDLSCLDWDFLVIARPHFKSLLKDYITLFSMCTKEEFLKTSLITNDVEKIFAGGFTQSQESYALPVPI